MLRFRNNEDYQQYYYKKDLKRTVNGLGLMLVTVFVLEMGLDMIIAIWSQSKPFEFTVLFGSSDMPSLLLNGVASAVLFFVVAGLYVLLEKRSFGALFPFEKVGKKKLAMLCTIGIALSLLSNLAPEMLSEVFGMFGISNQGGDVSISGSGDLPSVLMYYLVIAIIPAFTEEFAFRGVILGSLRKYSDGLALVVSSAMFALMHGNFVQIPFTFCCGLMFGFLLIKTNSMLPGMIVHFLNNGLSVTFDLLYQYNIMSSNLVNLCYGVVIVITGILALIFLRRFAKEDDGFFKVERSDDVIPYREKVKTAAGSPTVITFSVMMLLSAVFQLMQPYLMSLLPQR